jgi:hypothetical protein
MLIAKIDLLMKKLETLGLDHIKMVDGRVTCEECRETSHMDINYPMAPPRMSTSLVILAMVFILIKTSMLGGISPVSRSTTTNKVV